MEDLSEMRIKIDESSALIHSETPRTSLIDSTTDFITGIHPKLKTTSFISPNRFGSSSSFFHTRSGSSILSPKLKSSFLQESKPKEFSLQKLDDKLNRISEEFNTERNGGRETAVETFREKPQEGFRESKTFVSTERSTLARQLSEDFELSRVPTLRWCAFCGKETSTEVEFRNSSKTFWTSLGIFLMGGVFGCFLIPYTMTRCKESKFICHLCKREVSKD